MKLDRNNYVPILKWKRAEQASLHELSEESKSRIAPLVELVMPKPKGTLKDNSIDELYSEVISIFRHKRKFEIANEINNSWGTRSIFVDFTLLYPEVKLEALNHICSEAAPLKLKLTLVVNLSDPNEYKSAVIKAHNEYKYDICIRVSDSDLENIEELNLRLSNYLKISGATASSTHILIDLKDPEDYGDYKQIVNSSQKILHLNEWAGLILSSGSFPLDLSDCKRGENYISRLDWSNWKKLNARADLTRIPTFSDYGIRYPIYNESYQFLEPTASVKYALEDEWLIIKGQKRKYEQFLAAAALLSVTDSFYGKEFSKGDAYIAEKALHYPKYMLNKKLKGTGTTELWLKAGLNHHLSVVAGQIANLA